MTRTCGDCSHLDPRPILTQSPRKLHRCEKRCTLEFLDTPRGEPDTPDYCTYWTEEPITP